MRIFKDFWRDASGATAIEYALVACIISLVIVAALKTMGPQLANKFVQVSRNLG